MGAKRTDTTDQLYLPLETLQGLLAQYSHQLLCLEAALKEQVRLRVLKPRGFRRRLNNLKEVQLRVRVLKRRCAAEGNMGLLRESLDLALLSSPTPVEKSICERFLRQREALACTLEKEASQVYRWLLGAVAGRTMGVWHMLRLSAMRRMIALVDKRKNIVEEMAKSLNSHVEKLLYQTDGGQRHASNRTSIEGLITLFQEVEKLVARVANLKSQLTEEQKAVAYMESWLHAEEQRARARNPRLESPSPLDVLELARHLEDPESDLRQARIQKDLAAAFWQEVVLDGGLSPAHSGAELTAMAPRGKIPTLSLLSQEEKDQDLLVGETSLFSECGMEAASP